MYWRRKSSSLCFIGETFTFPEIDKKDCFCTDEDFEWFIITLKILID